MKGKNIMHFNGKLKALLLRFVIIAFLPVSFLSCATVGEIVGDAGLASGLFGEKTAAAIKNSGVAFSSAFEDITPEQEYYIGRAVAANILASYKVQTNRPALTAYTNRICNALVINSVRPEIFNGYHVNILDTDEINAFATPGGHIFLTRGIINYAVTSEDTLASVIAHEIAHIQLQHGLKAIKNNRRTQAALSTVSVAGAAVTESSDLSEIVDSFNSSINDMVTTLLTNGYSRAQELDADSVAMSLMSLAGYEPASLIDMLKVLEKNQSNHPGGFNRTHPTPTQRITSAEKTAGKYKVEDTRSYRQTRYSAAI
jgi:predicted Zn-dependent protease